MDSDTPKQLADKKYRAGDLHPAFVADKEVVKGHAEWRHSDMEEKIDSQTRKVPGARFFGRRGAGIFCVGCRRMLLRLGARIGGGGRALACVPCEKGGGPGIRCMGSAQGLFTSENGSPVEGCRGHMLGVDLERGGRYENGQGAISGEGRPGPGMSTWITQDAWAGDRPISSGYLWGRRRNGRFGVRASRLPRSRRMASTAAFMCVLHASGSPRVVAGPGVFGRRRMAAMKPRLRSVGPGVST